jgi:hypothetical protein
MMKVTTLMVAVAAALAVLLVSFAPVHGAEGKKAKKAKLRHVVAFKFKGSASSEQIKKVEQAFADLPQKISSIDKYEAGTNNSPEKLNKGCTHAFILTFKSEKQRDDYLVHPAHKEFASLVGPLVDDVFVIDFWTKE